MRTNTSSFAELLTLKNDLEATAKQRQIEKEAEDKRKKLAHQRAHEFENAMSQLGVQRKDLNAGRVSHSSVIKPAPIPHQRFKDEKEVLKASLSDDISIDHLLGSDERLSYHASQVSKDVPKKLRSGTWSIKGSLDLHGYTTDEARDLLVAFLNEQRKQNHRAVRIIHGKGYGSVGRKPILKEKVPAWLIQRKEVLAFVQAPEHDGGSGALWVLLAPDDK